MLVRKTACRDADGEIAFAVARYASDRIGATSRVVKAARCDHLLWRAEFDAMITSEFMRTLACQQNRRFAEH